MTTPGERLLRRVRGASPDRSVPTDVAAVLVFVAVADVVVLARGVPTPVRAAFGTTLLFFLPGYGVVTALFPAGPEARTTTGDWYGTGATESPGEEVHPSTDGGDSVLEPPRGNSITGAERVALGVGASLAVIPLVGLALSATGLGFVLLHEVGALSLVAGGGVVVGWVRRSSLPEHRRFGVDPRERLGSIRAAAARLSRGDAAVSVLLVVAALVAAGALSYALLVPPAGGGYTELSLLTETEDGDLVASDYPAEFEPGETREVVSAVENEEGHAETYTLVVELQRIRTGGEGSGVVESRTLERRQVTVEDGDRAVEPLAITPEMQGEDLRVTVLLYEGSPSESRDPDDAYRHTYIWIDVGSGGAPGGAAGTGNATGETAGDGDAGDDALVAATGDPSGRGA